MSCQHGASRKFTWVAPLEVGDIENNPQAVDFFPKADFPFCSIEPINLKIFSINDIFHKFILLREVNRRFLVGTKEEEIASSLD